MDLRRWSHVLALAECRSFVRAAEKVHLTQSALTRSIQAAESELGMALFDRRAREVVPTAAGEFVVERARQLLFDSRSVERDIHLYRSRELGDVAFGVGPVPAATFLAALLADIRREQPAIGVRVMVGNWQLLVETLFKEDIEFFVADARNLPADARLLIRRLNPEPGGFYVRQSHPLPKRQPVTLKEVWGYGVASGRLPEQVHVPVARALGLDPSQGVPLALECDDFQVLKSTALACDLVLAVPHRVVEKEVADRSLRPVAVAGLPPLFSEPSVVFMRGRTPSPMAELVVEKLTASKRRRS